MFVITETGLHYEPDAGNYADGFTGLLRIRKNNAKQQADNTDDESNIHRMIGSAELIKIRRFGLITPPPTSPPIPLPLVGGG